MASQTRYYPARFNITSIGGLPFAVAETGTIKGRQHRRIVGYSYKSTSRLYGRPILYSDYYISSRKRYVYARHKADPIKFFEALDYFYYQQLQDYSELEGREFNMVLNIGGKLEQMEQRLPFSPLVPIGADIRFFRIEIPFGDIAVEFGNTMEGPEEISSLQHGQLPQALESPLLGCELTKSNLLAKLIAALHWAEDTIPTSILEQAIAELISEGIPA